MKRPQLVVVLFTCASVLAGPALQARGEDPVPSVTLKVSPTTVVFGDAVRFSGEISPPSAGQAVEILDAHAHVLAQATTDVDGTYETSAKPRRNATVHAQWGAAASHKVPVAVRPRLTAKRSEDVRLFDAVTVSGALVPPHGGSHIDVTVWAGGKPVQRFTPTLNPHGHFEVRYEVVHAGRQSVVVHFQDGDHAGVSWRSKLATPPMPSLGDGSSGVFVQLLEKRLAELHYRVYAQDPDFDYHDADAVLAFHKVQGMPLTSSVDAATWRALAAPKVPEMRGPKKGKHFEVDLTKQVLYYVVEGQVHDVIHVSTGKPSTPTYPGDFHVWTKQAGTNSKGMYYSSFFDGNRALHGYPEVPSYAASHGCVRMPFWVAIWVYDRAPYGIQVLVYS
jgi:hypothetical protein